MKTVESWQTKKIYAIANALGYVDRQDKDNDILHMIMFSQTGKHSTKELTYRKSSPTWKNNRIIRLMKL